MTHHPATDTQRGARILGRPIDLNGLRLANRIVMAPMTRERSPAGIPGEDVAAYYARRVAGGVGLIITEGTYIGHDTVGTSDDVPRFHGENALAGWRRVAEAVHREGGRIVPQLWHVGVTREEGQGPVREAPVLSPSGLDLGGKPKGRAATLTEIDAIIAAFAESAAAAERVGFDGVEIHGAHGYLVDEFLWDRTNRRDDRFGGGPAERARFAAEIVAAIRAAVSAEFPVIFRFSQWKSSHYDARIAGSPDELERLLAPLAEAGVDAFHASTRRYWLPEFDGSDLNLAGWARKLVDRPTISVGSVGLDKPEVGPGGMAPHAGVTGIDELLDRMERDEFDLIAVGRSLIANPDWAALALRGEVDAARPFDVAQLRTLE